MWNPRDSIAHDEIMEKLQNKQQLSKDDVHVLAYHMYLYIAKAQINGTYTDEHMEQVFKIYDSLLDQQTTEEVSGCIAQAASWLTNPSQNPKYLSIKSKLNDDNVSLSDEEQFYLAYIIMFSFLSEENPDFESKFDAFTKDANIFEKQIIQRNCQCFHKWLFEQ